jgi:opacity protein-like surface antigen
MCFKKLSIYLLFTAIYSLVTIGAAKAADLSALNLSFSDPKVEVLPEQTEPKPPATAPPNAPPNQSPGKEDSREQRQNGWYWTTSRGANFLNMNATAPTGEKANWAGADPLGSLANLTNLNVAFGFKSSSFRLEGEVLVGNNSMTIDRPSTTARVVGSPDPANPGSTVPLSNGVPVNCKATTFSTMVSGYYDLNLGGQITPFVGGGIGYATTLLKDGPVDWGSEAGVIYQLKAGVGYNISEGQDIYVQYKFLNPPAQYTKQNGEGYNTILNSTNIEIGTRIKF